MTTRLRIVAVVVQVEAFADDGDELTPLPIQPMRIPIARWADFAAGGFDQSIVDLRTQIEQQTGP